MLATEEPTAPSQDPAPRPSLLEQWPQNERMRHIPPIPWIIQKLDHDVRRRIERLLVPYSDVASNDLRHGALDVELRALCRSLDRVAFVSGRGRHGHAPNDLPSKVRWSLDHAIGNLSAMDADTFGRRYPMQTFERSNAEPLWGALLGVIQHLQKLVPLIREIEPEIDERMYEGLVNLIEPMRREPIA
ncbi:MAG TPA: hypothetical protein VGQ36_14195 [Thermoanaerobaculia bacterium]|jgi:hypothetical protein|nr:hypothetical protein [Thermoanaerobaculia bacterium]